MSRRLLTAGVAGALLLASVAPATAQEEPAAGVGSSDGTLTLLQLEAGDLLSVVLGADDGLSNTDEAVGDPLARVGIVGASVSSDALGIDISTPPLSSESGSGEADEQNGVGAFETPASAAPALAVKIDPLNLSSAVDDDGARSGLDSTIGEVSALGGLATFDNGNLNLTTVAGLTETTTERGVTIDQIRVDLGSLLDGVGLGILDLPLEDVLALLTDLGLDTSVLEEFAPVVDEADQTLLDEVLAQVDPGSLLPVIDPILGDVTGLLGAEATTSADPTSVNELVQNVQDTVDALQAEVDDACDGLQIDCADVQAAIDLLQDLLAQLLGLVQDTLENIELLSLDDIDVGARTLATETVEASVADINATIGNVRVLGTDLGSLDLTQSLETVNALVDQVNVAVNDLLSALLGEVIAVDIALLEQVTEVGKAGDLVTARASLVTAAASIGVDLAALEALLDSLSQVETLRDTLAGLGIEAPASLMDQLNALLLGDESGEASASAIDNVAGTEVLSLSEGASLSLGELSQTSTFQVAAQTTTGGDTPVELPRTGGSTLWLLLGAGALVIALGLRRTLTPARG